MTNFDQIDVIMHALQQFADEWSHIDYLRSNLMDMHDDARAFDTHFEPLNRAFARLLETYKTTTDVGKRMAETARAVSAMGATQKNVAQARRDANTPQTVEELEAKLPRHIY